MEAIITQNQEYFDSNHEIKDKTLAHSIVGVKDDDLKKLSKYVLKHIETVIRLPLPGYDECCRMSMENRYFWSACKIPLNLGLDIETRETFVNMETTSHRVPRTWVPDINDEVEQYGGDDASLNDGFQFYSFTRESENKDYDKDGESDVDYDRESDVDSDTESDVDYDRQSDVDSDTESDVGSDTESDVDYDRQSDVDSDTESNVDSDTESDVDSDTKSDVSSDRDSDVDYDRQPDVDSDRDSDVDSDGESNLGFDRESDIDSDREYDVGTDRDSGRVSNTSFECSENDYAKNTRVVSDGSISEDVGSKNTTVYEGIMKCDGNLQQYMSMYEKNNIYLDLPYHEDLGKAATVRELMSYAARNLTDAADVGLQDTDRLILRSEDNEESQDISGAQVGHEFSLNHLDSFQEEPLQRSLGAIITGDGAPVEISHRIKDEESSTGKTIFDNVTFLLSGFHTKLEFYRMKSKLTEEFWGYFVSKWRTSALEMKWIMEPSDPNDLENELPQYIAAHYRAASYCLQKKKGSTETISVTEVRMFLFFCQLIYYIGLSHLGMYLRR